MSPDADQPSAYPGLKQIIDLEPKLEDFRGAVVGGLSSEPKSIPPKFFYDERGSHIFNDICETPEYYVTRTEIALLGEIGPEIAELAGPSVSVIEYGCGSSSKIRTLLGALRDPAEYWGIDISREHLLFSPSEISIDFPGVDFNAVVADFVGDMMLPSDMAGRKLAFFPGSTIGNQTPEEAAGFLKKVRGVVGREGALLIGADVRKDVAVLNRAYNDAAGHTAAFNLNLLHRMKSELGAELNVDGFAHLAFYNEDIGRIEMHLKSIGDQIIRVAGQEFKFADGETLHTENSYKYDIPAFTALAEGAGFEVAQSWTDKDDLFGIHFLDAAPLGG
ncbi:MAG: L-histidine N(alpha)-methyltransferase [Rhodospirillales bacterium]|nr:L-histidine N(alpha)-methyltransferase [Rhodospirillales bacterium]